MKTKVSCSNFVNHIDGICKPLFGKRNVTPGSKSTSTSVLKQSFTNDSTCENKRKEYFKLLNIYRHNNTVENKIQMINARKHYKTV